MRITMIGSGYVGLVTGVCLADFGHEVICVDKIKSKIAALKGGRMPIFEPGLEDLVRRNAAAGQISFSTDVLRSVSQADVVFIAVGTPSRAGDGHADLTYVYAAAREIGAALRGFTVIAVKSTVPVGTGDEVERIVRSVNPSADFAVVSNPEFLREGAAIEDFKRPDRIVVGIDGDERARDVMSRVYRPLYLNKPPLVFTSRRTSELIKYAANAFLALKITYINEIADLCENVGAHVQDVARGIGLDKRIGSKFLHAGPGYGGSCFPKDTSALVRTAQDSNSPLRLIETAMAINEQRKRTIVRKVVHACGGNVRDKTIAILGLTFKPNTDDMREAPSLSIIQALLDLGASVKVFDPEGMEQAQALLASSVSYALGPYDCAAGAEAIVIVTEWDQFRALDLDRLNQVMARPVIVDLRNIYRREDVARHRFHYVNVGEGAPLEPEAFAEAAE